MKTLNFDEEIIIDYNALPFDDTEGAEQRDLDLIDSLYEEEWIDDDPDLDCIPSLDGLGGV